jgi:hypothetical protein
MNESGNQAVNGGPPELPPPHREPERRAELVVVDALPGLARIAAGAWIRSAVWSVGASVRLSRRIAEAALSPDVGGGIVREFGSGIRSYARELLGVSDLDDRVRELMPASTPASRMRDGARGGRPPGGARSLREQGAALLRQSADVDADDDMHPAYERILGEIAPDEARILRLLSTSGPQASVDVRAANLIGVGSQLVAPNLNMIGTEAGCRHLDRVPAYLNNLQRLGLICFSDEAIDDLMAYQVIEAQPEAIEALRRAGRAKTVHRSVRLTAFGVDFCNMVLAPGASEHAGSPAPNGNGGGSYSSDLSAK